MLNLDPLEVWQSVLSGGSEIKMSMAVSYIDKGKKESIENLRKGNTTSPLQEEFRYEMLGVLRDQKLLQEIRKIFTREKLTLDACPSLASIRQRSRLGVSNHFIQTEQEISATELIENIPGIIIPNGNKAKGVELVNELEKLNIDGLSCLENLWELHAIFHENKPSRLWRRCRLLGIGSESSMYLITMKGEHYVPHPLVEDIMKVFIIEIISACNQKKPVDQKIRLTELMYIFNRIHPFGDGNWRTCMLFFNIILKKMQLPLFQLSIQELKMNHDLLCSPKIGDFVNWEINRVTKPI